MKEFVFKTILLGNSGVGKTSIMERYKSNVFDIDCKSTIGIDFFSFKTTIDDYNIKLNIWDTAGQEKYSSIVQSYYRQIAGAFLIYDINNQGSLDDLNLWIDRIKYYSPSCEIIIVGNKCEGPNILDTSQYSDIKHKLVCSAKTGIGISKIFEEMINILFKKVTFYSFVPNSIPGIIIYEDLDLNEEVCEVRPKSHKCCNLL